jgi:hypothetical protein
MAAETARRADPRHRTQPQRPQQHDFETASVTGPKPIPTSPPVTQLSMDQFSAIDLDDEAFVHG